MHERIIEHISEREGVRWLTFDEIADDFARRQPRQASQRGSPGAVTASSRTRCLGWSSSGQRPVAAQHPRKRREEGRQQER